MTGIRVQDGRDEFLEQTLRVRRRVGRSVSDDARLDIRIQRQGDKCILEGPRPDLLDGYHWASDFLAANPSLAS